MSGPVIMTPPQPPTPEQKAMSRYRWMFFGYTVLWAFLLGIVMFIATLIYSFWDASRCDTADTALCQGYAPFIAMFFIAQSIGYTFVMAAIAVPVSLRTSRLVTLPRFASAAKDAWKRTWWIVPASYVLIFLPGFGSLLHV